MHNLATQKEKSKRGESSLKDAGQKSPARIVAELHEFQRSPKYRIRVTVKERDGARWLSLAGVMLTVNGWIPAQQRVNFGPDEIDSLLVAIEDANEILASRRAS